MKKIFNAHFFAVLTKLLVLVVVANIVALGLFWFLPQKGESIEEKTDYTTEYIKIDFANMLTPTEGAEGASTSHGEIILKGLYGTKNKGFVIVSMQSAPMSTSIVGVGEVFGGYTLKTIAHDGAVFMKNNQDYNVPLEDVRSSSIVGSVGNESETSISHAQISEYVKNPAQISKSISFQEVKQGSKLQGYRITRVEPNSKFDKLGLKTGDLITKVNNRVLNSYNDVLSVYKNIDKLSALQIVVKRDNQEKEFVYEIN